MRTALREAQSELATERKRRTEAEQALRSARASAASVAEEVHTLREQNRSLAPDGVGESPRVHIFMHARLQPPVHFVRLFVGAGDGAGGATKTVPLERFNKLAQALIAEQVCGVMI